MTMDVLVVLDRSGSMNEAKSDHEGGLRSFIEDQKGVEGTLLFTLVQFDTEDPCEILFDRVPIRDVDPARVHLIPRGGTPLLDACGKALAHLEARQKDLPSDTTLVMIITDGEENSSTEWTKSSLKARIEAVQQAGATVLFLGANVDAFHEGAQLGVAASYVANYTNTKGVAGNFYRNVSAKVGATRSRAASSHWKGDEIAYAMASSMTFSDRDRDEITGTTVDQSTTQSLSVTDHSGTGDTYVQSVTRPPTPTTTDDASEKDS